MCLARIHLYLPLKMAVETPAQKEQQRQEAPDFQEGEEQQGRMSGRKGGKGCSTKATKVGPDQTPLEHHAPNVPKCSANSSLGPATPLLGKVLRWKKPKT